jgi:hypothetical protein
MILNLNGILFAVQVVLLLFVGPYADYGNWRAPFLLGEFHILAGLMMSNGNNTERLYFRIRRIDPAISMASRQRLVCDWKHRYVLPSPDQYADGSSEPAPSILPRRVSSYGTGST